MTNSAYWKQRFTQLEQAQNQLAASSLSAIERQYRQAQKQIEADIAAWYQRFADNNGISMGEARQWLKGKDLKEFRWSVKDYIKYGQENALSGQWMKELENASARFHISRLEALKIHTEQSLQAMFQKQQGTVTSVMGDVFKSGYYHTAYELQRGFGIGFDIAAVDQSYLERVLAKPWAADGYNFSERIWKSKDKLIQEIHTELSRNIMLGQDPQKAIDSVAKKLNTSKANAGRLVLTEEAYFSSAAQKDCFNDLGVTQYEIVATLDSHTSEICQNLDGQHFPMKDYEPGVTAPPFHVNCRSTTAPYFEDNFGQVGERAARGEDGKTYYVPDTLTYKKWKTGFVDGDKTGLTESPPDGKMSFRETVSKVREDIAKSGGKVQEKHLLEAGKALSGEFTAHKASDKAAYEAAKAKLDAFGVSDLEARLKRLRQAKFGLLTPQEVGFENTLEISKEIYALSGQLDEIKSKPEYIEALEAAKTAERAYHGKQADNIAWLKERLSEIREMGSEGLPIMEHLNKSRSAVRKFVETAYSNYPKAWVEKSVARGNLTPKKVDRGFYNDWQGVIAISTYGGDENALQTAFHELGHRFERAVPAIRDAEEAFYNRRTAGESLRWLGAVTGNKGYAKSEKTRKDKFVHPYMGKDYGGSAYELVSMGFEYAFSEPWRLADDPDMQAWIYGILALL